MRRHRATGHAGQGDSVGPPHPHTRAHGMPVTDPNNTPRGRAIGGGGAPDHRHPSQRRKVPPPGTPFRHPHSEQRRPARAHAVRPGLGPHTRTDRTRDTGVAEPRLPTPEDGRPGEGQRLTPDTPRNSGRPSPPGDGPPPAPRHTATTGHAGQGNSVGPPHPHTRAHSTCVADPNSPPSGRAVGGGTAPDLRRPSQWWEAPPPGTPFRQPHSEQRRPARAHAVGQVLRPHARTVRTRDTRVAEPRLPAPEDGHPGEGQRLTPDAPHNCGTPSPRGRPPTTPTGHAGQGDGVGPPNPHTRAHSTWVADPNSPPSGRAVGGGTAPDLRHPSQWWKAPCPGMPFRHPYSEQCRPARTHAEGSVLGPHARNDRTRDTRDAEPWLPAPKDRQPGEGRRLTLDAPHNGRRPPPLGNGPPPTPRHAAPTGHAGQGDSVGPPYPHTRAHSTWVADPNSPPSGRAVGAGTVPDLRGTSQWWKAPSPGTPFRYPNSEQRRHARAHAVGPGLGPHTRTDRTRDTRVAEPRLPTPEDGRPGEGQRLTPDAPRNSGRPPPPPGDAPPPAPRHAAPTGHAGVGDSVGPPHPHTRAHSTWVADPNSPPSGRAVGGGTAPDLSSLSEWWKAPPPGTPFRHPHSEQRRPTRAHAVGPVLGPHARTDCTRDTLVAEPWLPAPEDGRPGEGQRLTPDAPHNGGGHPPPGTPFRHPHSEQRRPAGAQGVGPVLGPNACTDRTRDTRVAEP